MRALRNTCRRSQSGAALVLLGLTLGGVLLARLAPSRRKPASLLAEAASVATDGGSGGGLASYFSSARQLLDTGMEAHNSARTYSGLLPNEDPRTAQLLRDTMDKTGSLLDNYRHEGLTNLPALPDVMGLGALMRVPDKLLRAELSMLQDGLRMAEQMRERPIQATMNTPRELATMFVRMVQQLNQ